MHIIASHIKRLATVHRQSGHANFFIFATPRSGSTWLAELLATQGRFKIVNEPLNLRKQAIRENLGLEDWNDLFRPECRPLIRSYLLTFLNGSDRDLRYKREWPFTRFWHARTDRIVFKMLFGGEDDMHWYGREFGGHVIHLLRHPIAVAQSREQQPRLHSYLTPPYSNNFSGAQLEHAQAVIRSGDAFRMRVLDWCLQNFVPLRHASAESLVLTYEQLVVEPEVVISALTRKYALARPHAMLRHVYRASRSTGKSSATSQSVLRDEGEIRRQREWLIDKWQTNTTPHDVERAFKTLSVFGIEVYSPGSSLPAREYLLDGEFSSEKSAASSRTRAG